MYFCFSLWIRYIVWWKSNSKAVGNSGTNIGLRSVHLQPVSWSSSSSGCSYNHRCDKLYIMHKLFKLIYLEALNNIWFNWFYLRLDEYPAGLHDGQTSSSGRSLRKDILLIITILWIGLHHLAFPCVAADCQDCY